MYLNFLENSKGIFPNKKNPHPIRKLPIPRTSEFLMLMSGISLRKFEYLPITDPMALKEFELDRQGLIRKYHFFIILILVYRLIRYL